MSEEKNRSVGAPPAGKVWLLDCIGGIPLLFTVVEFFYDVLREVSPGVKKRVDEVSLAYNLALETGKSLSGGDIHGNILILGRKIVFVDFRDQDEVDTKDADVVIIYDKEDCLIDYKQMQIRTCEALRRLSAKRKFQYRSRWYYRFVQLWRWVRKLFGNFAPKPAYPERLDAVLFRKSEHGPLSFRTDGRGINFKSNGGHCGGILVLVPGGDKNNEYQELVVMPGPGVRRNKVLDPIVFQDPESEPEAPEIVQAEDNGASQPDVDSSTDDKPGLRFEFADDGPSEDSTGDGTGDNTPDAADNASSTVSEDIPSDADDNTGDGQADKGDNIPSPVDTDGDAPSSNEYLDENGLFIITDPADLNGWKVCDVCGQVGQNVSVRIGSKDGEVGVIVCRLRKLREKPTGKCKCYHEGAGRNIGIVPKPSTK